MKYQKPRLQKSRNTSKKVYAARCHDESLYRGSPGRTTEVQSEERTTCRRLTPTLATQRDESGWGAPKAPVLMRVYAAVSAVPTLNELGPCDKYLAGPAEPA